MERLTFEGNAVTNKEILQTIQALRACASGEAEDCPFTEVAGCDGCPKVSADLIERLTDENAALREKNWGGRQQMSEKLYGAYLTSVQNVREAKLELAKQAAQCVERAMLDDDMFLVKGDTVGWKVRIYRNEADNYVEELP